ncbi:MAG: anhydro-N-acetylmuramic acid kinase [Vampirovibrionales bacterium]|nr:anhydro-N-acetylmuramic acid kinase [Vampirovibrionales bacterium]
MFAFRNPREPLVALGLMSGTSADAIDACAARFCLGQDGRLSWEILATATRPFEDDLRARLLRLLEDTPASASEFCALNAELGEAFAQAALAAMAAGGLRAQDIDVIGSHGQTLAHMPPGSASVSGTLQLAEPAIIAARTSILTIADFRQADMAAGGHGAPLVPLADRWLFQQPDSGCAMQNIGGVGNVTLLPPKNAGRPIRAFDTGPGNLLIDAAMRRLFDASMDRDGTIAASGACCQSLLSALNAHPAVRAFLDAAPPKSTGRDLFNEALLESALSACGDASAADIIATLTAFTAQTIADSLARWGADPAEDIRTLIIGGGGAKNPTLMRFLDSRLRAFGRPIALKTHADYGIPNAYKEALAFALLAWASLCGAAGAVPSCTGARYGALLGKFMWGGAPARVLE